MTPGWSIKLIYAHLSMTLGVVGVAVRILGLVEKGKTIVKGTTNI
jgi:hypothetical protein